MVCNCPNQLDWKAISDWDAPRARGDLEGIWKEGHAAKHCFVVKGREGSHFPMQAQFVLIGCILPPEWGLSGDGARETRLSCLVNSQNNQFTARILAKR